MDLTHGWATRCKLGPLAGVEPASSTYPVSLRRRGEYSGKTQTSFGTRPTNSVKIFVLVQNVTK